MRVNIAVCGLFHYRKYIGELSARGVLQNFYYSHRLSTNAKTLGIVKGRAVNLFLKEYCYKALIGARPLLGDLGPAVRWVHGLWESQLIRRWEDCNIFYAMVLGTALRPLGFARSRGAVTIGEPVMSHPRTLEGILSQEYDLLGIPKPPEWVNKDRIEEEMGQCDYLVSGSRFIRDSFVANGFPADRIFLNPIPIDTSRFTPLTESERGAVSDGKFRIICVAQIVPRKGVHYLLEAWKRLGLPASKAELLLIGQISPEMRPILDRYYGVFEHISAVPYDRLRLHFGRSSAFVIPSVEDGNAYVTGEAMGCGLPVIVTSNCGSADLVEDGVNGFVVPARSVEQLQKRLEQLYKDPALARSMGERNLELSRANFGVSACVDRFMNIYLEALSRGRR